MAADADPLNPIFKALADPTRRALLELLRPGPRTTGELCAAFPQFTRFAVIKHLGVLEEAGLIFVRPRGRTRWNHLNPAPLRDLYDGWLRAFVTRPPRGQKVTAAQAALLPDEP
jgi:DNA-binding transcriptional ArsR family regulator